MNRNTLARLGYSTFFTSILLAAPAQANNSIPSPSDEPMYGGYVSSEQTIAQPAAIEPQIESQPDTTLSPSDPVAADPPDCLCETDLLNDDAIGDEAIARMGCDCAGCRYIAMQMLQADDVDPN
ncbi:MAG: hypothetical protein HC769_19310 [Cyanobacteria bacterium CRU_2_1]|nr:hypothetical protein [Cyanobacteria bacterium RU_5_0]NJR60777.1 hypothetical protein [Cyanobacteria bacterium CRU_2_1]